MRYTKSKPIEISNFNIDDKISKTKQAKSFLPPTSITFSPTTATAGTGTVLTISGSGFGDTKGKVGFRDADSGGVVSSTDNTAVYIDALDSQVLGWSDTETTVEIPSNAGTGDIRVTNNDTSEGISGATLTISYALINSTDGLGTQHFSVNGSGNITWQMNTDFDTNSDAKTSFLRAFETWRCETNINWVIGATTSINSSAIDGVNVITFNNSLPEGMLGQCTYLINSCNPRAVRDLVSELDIVFDDATVWYFGTGFPGLAYDFESVALHELGHGHQLGHVIDTEAVMHYNLAPAEDQRTLSTNDINAAGVIQDFNTNSSLCNTTSMANYNGTCNLSIEEDELENAISIYPNPAKNHFFIKSVSFINLDKAVIYDVSGRLISTQDISSTSNTKIINIPNASKGIYFINIHSDLASITKKIILE